FLSARFRRQPAHQTQNLSPSGPGCHTAHVLGQIFGFQSLASYIFLCFLSFQTFPSGATLPKNHERRRLPLWFHYTFSVKRPLLAKIPKTGPCHSVRPLSGFSASRQRRQRPVFVAVVLSARALL